MRKIAIASAGSRPASITPLITPRAMMSTRVLETTFIITAIFSTPGPGQHQLRQRRGLRDRGVAADLAVVRGLAARRPHRVEERQRSTARADDQPEVAVELDDAPGHAARVGGVHLRPGDLERGRRARLARVLLGDAELGEQPRVRPACLLLHVDVRVEGDEGAAGEAADRVDLGQRQVVGEEDLHECADDAG